MVVAAAIGQRGVVDLMPLLRRQIDDAVARRVLRAAAEHRAEQQRQTRKVGDKARNKQQIPANMVNESCRRR